MHSAFTAALRESRSHREWRLCDPASAWFLLRPERCATGSVAELHALIFRLIFMLMFMKGSLPGGPRASRPWNGTRQAYLAPYAGGRVGWFLALSGSLC